MWYCLFTNGMRVLSVEVFEENEGGCVEKYDLCSLFGGK